MTTMPPTTSPSPSSSAMPRRSSGPKWTVAELPHRHRRAARADLGRRRARGPRWSARSRGRARRARARRSRARRRPRPRSSAASRRRRRRMRDAEGSQPARIEVDLVLLHEAADRRDLGDARRRSGASSAGSSPGTMRSCGEVVPAGACRPARTRTPSRRRSRRGRASGVTPSGRRLADRGSGTRARGCAPSRDRCRPRRRRTRTSPRTSSPAHVAHAGRRAQRGDDRVGDLVLDQVRAPARPLGEDDHLRVGEIRDRVERRAIGAARKPSNAATATTVRSGRGFARDRR